MYGENKRRELIEEQKKSLKREKTRNYIILYSTTLLILLILIGFSFYNGYFSGEEFIVNVVNNIIGILPALLIFDFFNEKLTRDSAALEMSEQITETLMSNPEVMDLFTEEQRKTFIDAAVKSIVKDEERAEMVKSTYGDYLLNNHLFRIRTDFHYDIELHERLPKTYDIFIDRDKYYYMQQKLQYTVNYTDASRNNLTTSIVKIGLAFGDENLDNALREKEGQALLDACIFREKLDISPNDIAYLMSLKDDVVLLDTIQSLFNFDLRIDNKRGILRNIQISEAGIVASFYVEHDLSLMEHSVRVIFHMPKYWGTVLEVAIIDPTKEPEITVSYSADVMEVEMYPFLSRSECASLEIAHEKQNGLYDIVLANEWVYPVSGIVFKTNKKEGV